MGTMAGPEIMSRNGGRFTDFQGAPRCLRPGRFEHRTGLFADLGDADEVAGFGLQ